MDFYKVNWVQFYIRKPLRALRRGISRRAGNLGRRIAGRWYCEGCHKHHGRRVFAYSLDGETACCFPQLEEYAEELASETGQPAPGVLAKLISQCEYIGSGRKNVTYEIRHAYAEKRRMES